MVCTHTNTHSHKLSLSLSLSHTHTHTHTHTFRLPASLKHIHTKRPSWTRTPVVTAGPYRSACESQSARWHSTLTSGSQPHCSVAQHNPPHTHFPSLSVIFPDTCSSWCLSKRGAAVMRWRQENRSLRLGEGPTESPSLHCSQLAQKPVNTTRFHTPFGFWVQVL